ncbi:MAG: sulfur carrier protein ThiS [Lachnospiraceae bacterium]|nr:sulfur carrier protein ThiS [Lachnospiraceae bacterium]MBQ2406189.1 sulfur carrier protein ThiS [Lachnospiraceae bacterium]MEE0919104.1 sulfur carrier protein ThiS [Lachnospiraceae bacterium]
MKVNGEQMSCGTNTSLEDFINLHGYRKEVIAVELNGDIVPKGEYANTILTEADTLEIVSFVGGG